MDDYESIKKISRQIAEKDDELASLFGDIIGEMIDLRGRNENFGKYESGELNQSKRRKEDTINRIGQHGNINVIPGITATSCQSYCVCLAFDKWQSSKGFRGIFTSVIDYWLACAKINRGTIIISYAWDDLDFTERYKKRFDHYASDHQHTIAVILISSNGISLQYFK